MVSTFGGLNTAMRGILAQQLSINTMGHNISNATQNGYSRQRVNLVSAQSQTITTGTGSVAQLGLGVVTQSITRCRDTFIDQQYWKKNPSLGYYKTTSDVLGKVEDILIEPSDSNLGAMLNKFWESINTLSTNASDTSNRTVVIQEALSLCTIARQQTGQLKIMVSDINEKIKLQVQDINDLTDQILALNKQIVATEAGGDDHANDLRDRRDYLVDQLSSIIDIQVTETEKGAFLISGCDGVSLVTATSKTNLDVESGKDPDYDYEVINVIALNSKGEKVKDVTPKNGELAALITGRDSEESGVKKYLNDLSNVAKFLLQEFNDVHKAGIDLDGNQGENFFGVKDVDYNDPSVVGNWNNAQWLSNLSVSASLADPVTGAAKVAARTLLGESTLVQSNPQSGHAIIGGILNSSGDLGGNTVSIAGYKVEVKIPDSSTYPDIGYDANGNLVTDVNNPTTILVDSYGNVKELEYVIYDNQNPPVQIASGICTPSPDSDTGSVTFEVNDPILQDNTTTPPIEAVFTIQIARVNKYNTAGSTYTFTIPESQQGVGAGDNAVNLCNRLKKDISLTLSDTNLDTYYSSYIATIGVQVKTAQDLADNQQTVINQLMTARDSMAGVNEDEEMVDMVRFQNAYNAASRVLTSMDEMLEKLINGTGRVGL